MPHVLAHDHGDDGCVWHQRYICVQQALAVYAGSQIWSVCRYYLAYIPGYPREYRGATCRNVFTTPEEGADADW